MPIFPSVNIPSSQGSSEAYCMKRLTRPRGFIQTTIQQAGIDGEPNSLITVSCFPAPISAMTPPCATGDSLARARGEFKESDIHGGTLLPGQAHH